MLSLNIKSIINILNKEQMMELYFELKKELSKHSYDEYTLKISRNVPYCNEEQILNVVDKIPEKTIKLEFEYA